LIARGANINNQQNRFGITPLHTAAEENHIAVVKLLLDKGADVSLQEASGGYTPLSRAGYREHWDVVKTLMEHGAVCQPVEIVGDWLFKECTKRERALKGTTN
jgi:ankyrin repeat protein